MDTIAHFLGENTRRIDFTGNMFHGNSVVLDPLANRVLTELNVMSGFRGHVVQPFNAGVKMGHKVMLLTLP
jgi:hypothetical protein